MIRNHIKISFRKIIKDKAFSIIKILSLAISLCCSIFIFLWIQDELSYDTYHPDADRIYRVYEEIDPDTKSKMFGPICGPAGAAIRNDVSQVEYIARTRTWGFYIFNYNENTFYEDKVVIAEPDILNIFHIPFISGDPKTALVDPNTIVITKKIATKYFGDSNPLGKTIDINSNQFKVTGVVEDCPGNTVFQYDILISFATFANQGRWENWYNTISFVFLKMKENVDFEIAAKGIREISKKYIDSNRETLSREFHLEPITEVHFGPTFRVDLPHGKKVYVYIFSVIGIMILSLGIINFINLTTSKFTLNFKEIAIRKIVGSNKLNLVFQSLIESTILSFIALNIALYLNELFLPQFNSLTLKNIDIKYFDNWHTTALLLAAAIFIGVISGLYPAIALSVIKPLDVFKNKNPNSSFNVIVRKSLVIFQFCISAALIISSMVIYKQIDYMLNKDLGFNKFNKLVLPIRGNTSIAENYKNLKQEFLKNPNINSVTTASNSIGGGVSTFGFTEGEWSDEKDISMYAMFIDADFLDFFDIEILAGRNYEDQRITDISSWEIRENGGLILNEVAANAFGWTAQEAIGKKILSGLGSRRLPIIGVVKNFHYFGLQSSIDPMVMEYFPNSFSSIILDINPKNIKESIRFAENKWEELFPDLPLTYYFADENFNMKYMEERRASKFMAIFAALAIFIACLGLYGLTLYTTEQKSKEIGIRKALGASVPNIIFSSSRNFILLVLISTIISWPIAYLSLNKWLENFHYHIQTPIWIFIAAGILIVILAQITIIFQAGKAANRNPVETLRYE